MRRQQVHCIPGKSTITLRPKGLLAAAVAALLMLAGCASAPERPTDWMPADMLPSSCDVFLSARVPENKELLTAAVDMLSKEEILQKGLDKTEYLYIGLENPGDAPDFYLVGSGSYPKGSIKTAFSLSSYWKKQKGTYPWYFNEPLDMGVSFPEPEMFCVSTGSTEPMLTRLTDRTITLPGDIKRAMLSEDIVLYLARFNPALTRTLLPGVTAFPAKSVFLTLTAEDGVYTMFMTAEAVDEKKAGVLSSAMKLVLLARARKDEFFSMTEFMRQVSVEVQGTRVTISGVSFTEAELLGLLPRMLENNREDDT